MEEAITRSIPLDIYQKEMKEMQREVNYLRKRVTDLNHELDKHRNEVVRTTQYLGDSINDLQYELDLFEEYVTTGRYF